jgi:ferrous iron transport protein A
MDPLSAFHRWLHRDPDGSRPIGADDDFTLADLRASESGQVLELCCGRLATNRLISLGFTPGAEVSMTQNYGHGPLIVTVRGGRVALGRGEARRIRVERPEE